MADLSTEEKCKLAVALVEQAPPGEVNDVINDIRAIINDDETLMPLIRPSLRAYNLAQLAVIEHPAEGDVAAHTSLLSEANVAIGRDSSERFVDYAGKRSFAFDHVLVAVSDYQPYELPEEEETFRTELATSLAKYAKNHFPTGISSVSCSQYPLLPPAPPKPETPPVSSAEKGETASKAQDTDMNDIEPTDMESAVADAEKQRAQDITDGDQEPEPTPVEGKEVEKEDDTVDEPGAIEKVDEELKQTAKEEDGERGEQKAEKEESGEVAEESTEGSGEKEAAESKAETAEADTEVEKSAVEDEKQPAEGEGETVAARPEAAAEAAPEPERKQERVENPTYTLEVVGNRYKTSNFWTGRWRTRWVVDQAKGSVDGTILVDVHYFEQGNVQLTTNHTSSFPCPSQASGNQSIASQIVTTISKIEAAYHMELNDVYEQLGEKAFRSLRRALPVTRQKMDWEKVSGYSLGADLSKARA